MFLSWLSLIKTLLSIITGEIMEEIMDEMNAVIEMILNDKKFISNVAKMIKKLHDELIKLGFSKEEAVKIASSYNIKG